MAYLRTAGTRFTLGGAPFFLFGASVYPSGGNAWSTTYIDQIVAAALVAEFNLLRFVSFYPTGNPAYNPENEALWEVVDYGLNACLQHGLKVLLDLSNYRNLLITQGYDPYTYDWTGFLSFVLTRVNTINGRTYSSDDTIAMLDIAGEMPGSDMTEELTFVTTASATIKSLDTNHLVCPGGIETYNPWQQVAALATIDCLCSHSYIETEQVTRWSQYQPYYASLPKPWFVEEMGGSQGQGDLARAQTFRRMYNNGLQYGAAGLLFWNFGFEATTGSDDVGTQTPFAHQMVRTYAHITGYTPRIPVFAAGEPLITS